MPPKVLRGKSEFQAIQNLGARVAEQMGLRDAVFVFTGGGDGGRGWIGDVKICFF